MNYNDDMMLREYSKSKPKSKFWVFFFFGFGLLTITLLLAYKTNNLPHWTLIIDGNKWEWVRDDPKYLAQQAQKPLDDVDAYNQQVIANNKAAFEQRQADQQHVEQALAEIESREEPPQVQQTTQTGIITKCLNAAGRVVYQENNCESTGLKPVKVLSQTELKGSRADAQNTEILQRNIEQEYKPAVVAINPDEKRNSEYCRDIDSQRENIRSQQRISSRQWHRDEYTRLSKIWQSECLG